MELSKEKWGNEERKSKGLSEPPESTWGKEWGVDTRRSSRTPSCSFQSSMETAVFSVKWSLYTGLLPDDYLNTLGGGQWKGHSWQRSNAKWKNNYRPGFSKYVTWKKKKKYGPIGDMLMYLKTPTFLPIRIYLCMRVSTKAVNGMTSKEKGEINISIATHSTPQ